MRDYADFITALIFRSQAIFLIEAEIRSKNRRLENFTLFVAQWVAHAQRFFSFSHCYAQRPHYPPFRPTMKKQWNDLIKILDQCFN